MSDYVLFAVAIFTNFLEGNRMQSYAMYIGIIKSCNRIDIIFEITKIKHGRREHIAW